MLGLLVRKDSKLPQELELAWSLTLSLGEQCPRAWGGGSGCQNAGPPGSLEPGGHVYKPHRGFSGARFQPRIGRAPGSGFHPATLGFGKVGMVPRCVVKEQGRALAQRVVRRKL